MTPGSYEEIPMQLQSRRKRVNFQASNHPSLLRRRACSSLRKRWYETDKRSTLAEGYEPATPRAVQGRQHFDIQTQQFYQILSNKPQEHEQQTQTDFYIDRPANRLFKPNKMGIDKSTWIDQGDLFDFNSEVEPILTALLTKTLERARMEVLEEQEHSNMKQQKKEFQNRRNVQLAQIQKIEASDQRYEKEADRRRLQSTTTKKQQINTHKRLISRNLAKQCLYNLKPNCYRILEDRGVFRDPLQADLLQNYIPWLYLEIHSNLSSEVLARDRLKHILQSSEAQLLKQSESAILEHEAKLSRVREEKEKMQRRKRQEKEKSKMEQLQASKVERKPQQQGEPRPSAQTLE